ncbi:hypothetical protein KC19_VG051300 [Ceratodon purpureus]|nr:hypothetical protein KC19_VG051300 [Ceratodon purpureus]
MQYFDTAGSDLIASTPRDYNPSPTNFLPRVQNVTVRKWALQIHELWLELTRKVSPSVAMHPEKHTLVPLNCSVVVPGARFKEVYYWDSYWVIKGLLVSGMTETAQGIVENLMELVERYGFVPNGARVYYENRSQPPLLSQMIRAVYTKTRDLTLLKRSLPILLKEYAFWTSAPHEVRVRDHKGEEHRLSRFWGHWNSPRPESFTIDINVTQGMNKTRAAHLYHDIATAAESGWDFSSRWMEDQQNMETLRTSMIIPVDLNVFLFQMEKNIEYFGKILVNQIVETRFANAAKDRYRAIQRILWSRKNGQWFDAWLSYDECSLSETNKRTVVVYEWVQKRLTYASNFVPLWAGVLPKGDVRKERVVEALRTSGLIQSASVATSLRNTGQQWDFPNAWAPLVDMVIEGLDASGLTRGRSMAREISRDWLRSNFVAYQQVGKMIEKYDATSCGKIGGVGEYNPQTGFGWSNGVVLSLLQKYGWPADEPMFCPEPLS